LYGASRAGRFPLDLEIEQVAACPDVIELAIVVRLSVEGMQLLSQPEFAATVRVAVGRNADHLDREGNGCRNDQPISLLFEGQAMAADLVTITKRRELDLRAIGKLRACRGGGSGQERDRQEYKF